MNTRMRTTAAVSVLFALTCCGQDPQVLPAPAATSGTANALTCAVQQQPCFCPDGNQSGIQVCSANTGLSSCSCLTSAAPAPGAGAPAPATSVPVSGAAARQGLGAVCAELEGSAKCDARSFKADELPTNILFVLDRSGSMACNPPPVQSVASCNMTPIAADPKLPSRWEITVNALKGVFEKLKSTHASAGLSFFSVDNACGVNSTPSVGLHPVSKPQFDALNAAMRGVSPRGGTPIVGAVVLAYSHLHEEAKAQGKRFVVLLTDGEESCGFAGKEENAADLAAARKHLLEVEVQKARAANIRTFVIGAPGSERARGFLSELAFAGGTARLPSCKHGTPDSDQGDCHYDLTQGADFGKVLETALSEISGHALTCEFPTPDGMSRMINVQYTASGNAKPLCLPFDQRACEGGADGFQFAKRADGTDDLSRVVLCGAACERVRHDSGGSVDVVLGCDSVLQ